VYETPEKKLGPEEQYLIDRYGDNVVGLLKYGSMAFGKPHSKSVHDFWVIVKNLRAFHRANEDFYRTELNVPSTVAEQVAANRVAPNFYAIEKYGLRMKIAVVSEHDFARFCRAKMMFVKGRMQKPLRVIRTTPLIEQAIEAARREGARHAVNLCPPRFTTEKFLYELCSLSYRAEIRPERKRAKVQSIIDASRPHIDRIYDPLLQSMVDVETNGESYLDTRSEQNRWLERRKTMGYLRRCKWSSNTIRLIWRNYRTHSAPITYIWHKIIGEFEKALDRHRARQAQLSRNRAD